MAPKQNKQLSEKTLVKRLAKLVQKTSQLSNFSVAGSLKSVDPGLVVAGVGRVVFPMKTEFLQKILAQSRIAPYGKGTRTLVNKKVRETFEIDAERFQVSPDWNLEINKLLPQIARGLGLGSQELVAKPYKLLIYEKGGHFVSHRDSEKHDRMVASLIVVLPQRFAGGNLVVQHQLTEMEFAFTEAREEHSPSFVAFYADCLHVVQKVKKGTRVCLSYNLVVNPSRVNDLAREKNPLSENRLSQSIAAWTANYPVKPIVFPLNHLYTKKGLALALLKGEDRKLADLIGDAAKQLDCNAFFCQVERHLVTECNDQMWDEHIEPWEDELWDDEEFEDDEDSDSNETSEPDNVFTTLEIYQDEFSGTEWTNLDGQSFRWGKIPFDKSAIVATIPLEQWDETKVEFEGYTGNEGGTTDRWYKRSALVLWQRQNQAAILASAPKGISIPLLKALVNKLDKSSRASFESDRNECLQMAQGILEYWSKPRTYDPSSNSRKIDHESFMDSLLKLRDRETISQYFNVVALAESDLCIDDFVRACVRDFGAAAFQKELKFLIEGGRHQSRLNPRDLQWLAAFCGEENVLPVARELCLLTLERFYSEPLNIPSRRSWVTIFSTSEQAAPYLVMALISIGMEQELEKLLQLLQSARKKYRLKEGIVPALKLVIPWSKKRFGNVPEPLKNWLAATIDRLKEEVSTKPSSDGNWTRPVEFTCECHFCDQLKSFLSDPRTRITRISAAVADHAHLEGTIHDSECDVNSKLERRGRAYSLVLTKTNKSFDRIRKEYEENITFLKALKQLQKR